MAQTGLVLCDTDVIIEFLKGRNQQVINELRQIGQANIAISVVTVGELLHGAQNRPELNQIRNSIASLKILSLDGVSSTFITLMTNYSLSHRLAVPDALIAATALFHGIPFYTLNVRHFSFISGLILYP